MPRTALLDRFRDSRGPDDAPHYALGTARELAAMFAALVNTDVVSPGVSAQVSEWLRLNHDLSLVGSVTGLIIGGALTEVSWRWIFLINVPIGLVILAFSFRALAETGAERLKLDVPGAILATLGCTAVVFGFTEGPEMGST